MSEEVEIDGSFRWFILPYTGASVSDRYQNLNDVS